MTDRQDPIVINYERVDIPEYTAAPRPPLQDGMPTSKVVREYADEEITEVWDKVVDEIERAWAADKRIERLVVGVEEYEYLIAMAFADSPRRVKPSHETVEQLVGHDVTVIEGSQIAVASADPDRTLHDHVLEEDDDEQ